MEYKNKTEKEFDSLVKTRFRINIKLSKINKLIKNVKLWVKKDC
jgi:hypothetical protein